MSKLQAWGNAPGKREITGLNCLVRGMHDRFVAQTCSLLYRRFPTASGLAGLGQVENLRYSKTANLLRTNEWCHLAAVISKTGLKMYFNGHLVASAKSGGTVPVPSNVSNFIGKSQWPRDAFFAGQIDELRIWNIERSAQEIGEGLEQKLNGTESGLIAYWSFDSGDGSTALPGGQRSIFNGQARCVEAPRFQTPASA
jgi:hypothetical protein